MADKDLGEELENIEEGIENLKNKEFRLFGIKITPMTAMALISAVGAVVGSLYGGFVMYQKMEQAIEFVNQQQEYEEKIAGFEEQMRIINNTVDSQQINMDSQGKLLKSFEENLRDTKQLTYDIEKRMNTKITNFENKMDRFADRVEKSKEDTEAKLLETKKELEDRIQKALDNPLAN
jgi:predicted RNA-binding protein with RPS1 domain